MEGISSSNSLNAFFLLPVLMIFEAPRRVAFVAEYLGGGECEGGGEGEEEEGNAGRRRWEGGESSEEGL